MNSQSTWISRVDVPVVCGLVVLVTGSVFFALLIWYGFNRDVEKLKPYNAFMAECIEHNTANRCYEFWRYGRADLGKPH